MSVSMWPLIESKDQIADLLPQKNYNIDDIIAFRQSKVLIAHRIIYIPPLYHDVYITKGDNNRVSDHLIKKSQILGAATTLRRNNQIIRIDALYKTQANNYLKELEKFKKLASNTKLKYIILKGIPIYLRYTGTYPRHFIFDADILIDPSGIVKLHKILEQLHFTISSNQSQVTEYSAIKKIDNFYVSLDIHLEPAIAFSQMPYFNRLLPQIPKLTREFWETSQNHLLSPNHQFVYLLLHALHHSYSGTTRWDLINKLRHYHAINSKTCLKIIKELGIGELVYGPLVFLEKYYGANMVTTKLINELRPRRSTQLLANLVIYIIKPWSYHHRLVNRLELLTYLLILSPLKTLSKTKILIYSITSIDFKVFKKWVKSAFA